MNVITKINCYFGAVSLH